MNVLLVEDEPSLREGLSELISELATVTDVSTVRAAEARLAERHFDLVLTDVQLDGDPHGGRKVVRAARERLTPVVALTALSSGDVGRHLDGAAPDGVLLKPFQVDDVLELVGRYVTSREELVDWSQKRDAFAALAFRPVESGVEMAVAQTLEGREVRWYRLSPGARVDRVSERRVRSLVVEGALLCGGVHLPPGAAIQTTVGWPVRVSTDEGSLNVAVVYTG